MPSTQQLREQRANVWSQMTEIMDLETRTADDDQKYDRLEAEYDRLDSEIERQERHEARDEVQLGGRPHRRRAPPA
jgi:HK97 family phage major capsid protein